MDNMGQLERFSGLSFELEGLAAVRAGLRKSQSVEWSDLPIALSSLSMKQSVYISDTGSTPVTSTKMLSCASDALGNDYDQSDLSTKREHPGGGVPVSTEWKKDCGGNQQATTARLRLRLRCLQEALYPKEAVIWNSANTKRQSGRVRAADGCLNSSSKRGLSYPGNRSDAGAFGVKPGCTSPTSFRSFCQEFSSLGVAIRCPEGRGKGKVGG